MNAYRGSSDDDLLSKAKFAGVEIGHNQGHDHQDQRSGAAEGGVARIEELALDQVYLVLILLVLKL